MRKPEEIRPRWRAPIVEKQMLRVLAAVERGYQTSMDIEEETGIPRRYVSVWLTELREMGLIKMVYRNVRGPWGHPFHRYEALKEAGGDKMQAIRRMQ